MKSGWEKHQLGDICDLVGGGTPSKDKAHAGFYSGSIPWATVRDMKGDLILDTEFKITHNAVKESSTNIIPKGNVVIATRVGLGKVCLLSQDTAINQDLKGVIPKNPKKLTVPYLFWWLKYIAPVIEQAGTGATVQGVKLPFVRGLEVPVPALPEQHRIVSILNQAFEGIATATANAERNLKNAREVFDGYLHSVSGEHKQLGDFVKITTGKLDANAAKDDGQYPFFTCSRQIYAIDTYAFDCEAILLAGNNASGDFNVKHYKGKFNAYQRTYVITVKDKDNLLYRYLYFQMLCSLKAFKNQAVGANTKFLKLPMIKGLRIPIPSASTQAAIVSKLDDLADSVAELESSYQQKLDALAELKKSILHQAFTGQLH